MKNIYLPIIILLTSIVLGGCYKHDDKISPSEESVIAVPEDSKDPLDHFIYEFYKNYNTVIYYKYSKDDYQWEVNERSDNIYTLQTDKYALDKGLEYVRKVFLDTYTDEFKKNYFPPAIFLAKQIDIEKGWNSKDNVISFYGFSHLAIGRIKLGIENLTAEELKEAKATINADFWGGYLLKNNMIDIPAAFYEISDAYYNSNLLRLPENSGKSKSEVDIRDYGFLAEAPGWNSDSYLFAPKKDIDIINFVKFITTHTSEEVKVFMEGFERLRTKYEILINYIKKDFGIDLQEIGNQQIN